MKRSIVIVVMLLLSSCEKNINFNLNNISSALVVDASIENDKPPVVTLTKSFNYFSSISPELLDTLFVHNATVTLSNGILTQQLKEYVYPQSNGYNIYSYTIDSTNLAGAFAGQLNSSYTLTIQTNGTVYTANTTIPGLNEKLDSLWWKAVPFNPDTADVTLMGKFTDPPGLGNYYRYFTQTNSGAFLPGSSSVFDDEVIDGTTYTFQIQPGVDRNRHISADSNYFKKGDTVTVKLCNIDKATYTFWNTWEISYQSIGNPFAEPNTIIGNVNNGALGDFSGYAAAYKTLIIPK